MDRRTSLKWMLAAAAVAPLPVPGAPAAGMPAAQPYGTDPRLLEVYAAGQLWPLTLSVAARRTVQALCDLIIPADAHSPSASSVGVVEFIDEWISAPYLQQREDRPVVLDGLRWLERQSRRRFARRFEQLDEAQMRALCDPVCDAARAPRHLKRPAAFFARFRDLTAAGFYTTPAGRADVKYVGNTPSTTFEGPPLEVLLQVGLA